MVSRKRNTLRTKLFRDMGRAAMQFLSIIALCALGTFAFAALDGTARMMRTTLSSRFWTVLYMGMPLAQTKNTTARSTGSMTTRIMASGRSMASVITMPPSSSMGARTHMD